MKSKAKNRLTDRLNFGPCEVCGEPAFTVVQDATILVPRGTPMDGIGHPEITKIPLCKAHARAGKVTFVDESEEAYFARLQVTEGAEI
jgi:hypothetical protein